MLAIMLGVLGFGIYLANYLGAFKDVDLSEATFGPVKLIYQDHQGAYHKIVSKIQEVEVWAKANGFSCAKTFGQYFDDPRSVDEERLRSLGGCLVDEFPRNLPPNFKTKEIPEGHFLQARFEGSPGIGPMKVYPKAEKYILDHQIKKNDSVIEVYEVLSEKEMKTVYYF